MTSNLVGIGRAYALKRRTDLALPCGRLLSGIKKPVGRKAKMRLLGYDYLSLGFDPHGGYIGALLLECDGIKHDSAANDVDRSFAEYSGRNTPHDETLSIEME